VDWWLLTSGAVGVVVGSVIGGLRRRETPRQQAITAALALLGGGISIAILWGLSSLATQSD
jgi:hypothetical protein